MTDPITTAATDTSPPVDTTKPAADSAVPLHITECAMCKAVDDHPKHGFVLNARTGEETRRHMDCCASVGCPVCADAIKDAGGITGHELRSYLVAQAPTATTGS